MLIRDCVEVDLDHRAECHRNARNHLAHIGLAQARSTFSAADYEQLRASPGYDPALDLLVETSDGRLVGNCICWSDAPSGIGTFEPVGVHVDFRQMGLARALTLEGLQRLQAADMQWARIGTAHFNAPAIATYISSGFEITDHTYWWSKGPG
jgi:ribosomal protein S18 acetylase RimI-like enzyme